MRVLLIEDDVDLAANVGEFLEARGYELEYAYDGLSGLHRGASESWDALILDLGLPGADGLEVCRRLRQGESATVPILVLTARDTLEDKIAGFEAGADDYVVKPFALAELDLRLQALHRRARGQLDTGELRVEDLVIDVATQTVTRAGQPLQLTRIGYAFLLALVRAAPGVVSKAEIERAIWGGTPSGHDLLRSHLYLLRQVVDRPFRTALIHTIHGRGYRIGKAES